MENPMLWGINLQPGNNHTDHHASPRNPIQSIKQHLIYEGRADLADLRREIAPKAVFYGPAIEERTNAERRQSPGLTATNSIFQ